MPKQRERCLPLAIALMKLITYLATCGDFSNFVCVIRVSTFTVT
jgi:hypothetical protein